MEYRALATLIHDSAALLPGDPMAEARLTARAAELGVPAAAAHVSRLWTAQGWAHPAAWQDEIAEALIWISDGGTPCSLPSSPR